MYSIEVQDLNYLGPVFTWCNRTEEQAFTAPKLDRVLGNLSWFNQLSQLVVKFGGPGISDHCYAIVTFGNKHNFGPKPFKFFKFWAEHKNFFDWVSEAWSGISYGTPMYILCSKLKAVKASLKKRYGIHFNGLPQRVLKARMELEQVQSLLLSSPSADLINNVKECSHHFISLSNAEESFMKQKARINWLNLGDQNTGYFHNSLKLSTARNSISCLLNEDGIEVEEPEAIKELAVNFYKRLLGRSSTSLVEDLSFFNSIILVGS